ncbi:hypothetical protein F5X68DRAFT_33857 [Plectosphaerella plurivora]|uniref:Zn(2)-C6 fungal-type domain-containing protein n=1 Tax=Plectosphaerella plurivora TaxID=936078 RepID=A0A9P8V6V5_9PEZI|nr:hypothetical protein F5X68DRAFT_33857 [Plectosphaerella plurivora]
MNRRSKQKSCYACAGGKRRCDRTLPTCARCIDRGVECAYPPPRETPGISGTEQPDNASNSNLSFLFPFGVQAHAEAGPGAPPPVQDVFAPQTMTSTSPETAENSLSLGTGSSPNQTSSANTPLSQSLQAENLRLHWFTAPGTWKLLHTFHPQNSLPPPQVSSTFLRGLGMWVTRFREDGHNPFIHRNLYPPRSIPDCIQDAYAAIAVCQGGSAKNENITEAITHSYATKLLSHQDALADQTLHINTAKDHLARTQALLIHLVLALTSNSLSRQAKAQALLEPLHRWKIDMLAAAEQEASLAQLFPCTASLGTENGGWGETDPVPEFHGAFVICESIRRTWLLCSMTTGIFRALRGDWTANCGGDICFTARTGLWDAESSGGWAGVARSTDPLFNYALNGEELVKRGIRADEVDEFAHLLFGLMWGADKVESWVARSKSAGR